MKRVLTLLLCVAMVLSVSACKKKEEKKEPAKTTTPSTTTTTEYYEKRYAHNDAIDLFFKEYLARYNNIDTATIHRGKDLTEYLAVIGECNVTVIDPADTRYALRIEIEGGTTEKQRDAMLDVFAKIAMTMEPGCTESMMEIVTERLLTYTATQTNVPVCGRVSIASYTPIIENAAQNVYTSCRMVLFVAETGDAIPTTPH